MSILGVVHAKMPRKAHTRDTIRFAENEHGRAREREGLDHTSFADDQLLQIVHDNWPAAIAFFRAPWSVPGTLSPQLSPEDRRKARKRLTVGWQASDGTIYLPPGGGASTAGLSPRVVSAADHLRQQAIAAEQWVRDDAQRIRDRIRETTGRALDELHMQFVLTTPLSVLETQTNSVIPLRFDQPSRSAVQV